METTESFWAFFRFGLGQSSRRRLQNQRPSRDYAAQVQILEQRALMSATASSPAPTAILPTPEYAPPPVHSFYVDPIHGSMSGDGSLAHPWHTLQEVISANLINGVDPTKGVVHAGDAIYLLDGDEGPVTISKWTGAFNNTSFITIAAYPGAHPVIDRLIVQYSSYWNFYGLTIASDSPNILAQLDNDNHIIFNRNTLYSQPDVTKWTPQDWIASAPAIAIDFTGSQATIINNTIKNVRNGAYINGDNINFSYNTIDAFADDALDFAVSTSLIHQNTITNHYPLLLDGNHNDGMQGWTVNGAVNSNVTIDANIVIASSGSDVADGIPAIPTGVGGSVMQGISIFDGIWNHVVVTNNLVEADAYHGIGMYGLSDSLIANNTVITETSNSQLGLWIGVFASKTGALPVNVVVRNNIASQFNLSNDGVFEDHNISLSVANSPTGWQPYAGVTYVADPKTLFVFYDPIAEHYNFRLLSSSFAVGSGNANGAPNYNILGIKRQSINIGAY